MRQIISIAILAALLALCPPAEAKDEGFYLGGSLGWTSLEQSVAITGVGKVQVDDNGYGYKIFGGYQLSPWLAVEGGFRDLGELSSGRVKTELDGFDAFAVAGFPLGPIRLFGKLGGIYAKSNTRIKNGVRYSNSGLEIGAGAGLEFELGSLALRGEIEYFGALDETWMYSAGATFTF